MSDILVLIHIGFFFFLSWKSSSFLSTKAWWDKGLIPKTYLPGLSVMFVQKSREENVLVIGDKKEQDTFASPWVSANDPKAGLGF
jgi:hypothetical protein